MDPRHAPATHDIRRQSIAQKRLVGTERQLVAVVQLDCVGLIECRQALFHFSIVVIDRAAIARVGAIGAQRHRLREHVRGEEGEPRVVSLLSLKDERVIARSAAAVAAVSAGIDVEVLRVGTQRLPHRLCARELGIRVRDPGLARERRIHAPSSSG